MPSRPAARPSPGDPGTGRSAPPCTLARRFCSHGGAALALLLVVGGACAPPPDDGASQAPADDGAPALRLLAGYARELAEPTGPWTGIGETTAARASLAGRERDLLAERANASGERARELDRELGLLYTRADETLRGAAHLTRALRANPDDALAWAGLGANRLRAGEPDEALVLLDRAATLAPDSADVGVYRGEALVRARRRDEARASFELAIELDPSRADARAALGALLEEDGELEAARRELELARAGLPEDPRVPFRLARIARAQGDDEAAARFEREHARLADLDDLGLSGRGLSRSVRAVQLGIHYLESDRPEPALAEFELALGSEPEPAAKVNALYGRTRSLLELGRTDAAREGLAALRAFEPNHPALAELAAELGDGE